ncbi:MAG: cupin domain-containing protein [Rhodospirillales bacterium]|nr:MAG: cupin domain-containing protein [Rhodospirillales bacterium]
MARRCDPVHQDTACVLPAGAPRYLRPVVTGAGGSATLAWLAEVPPAAAQDCYILAGCDEIVALVDGAGILVLGGERIPVRAGHCWLIPAGRDRCFENSSAVEPARLVGFWPGAPDLAAAGYRASAGGAAGPADRGRAVVIHEDAVPAERMDAGAGWSISDFRLPLGRHNGSATTLFRARFLPGAIHRKHRHEDCEEIYYVIAGEGLAGAGASRGPVRAGHFHHIPAGTEHWLVNRDGAAPVEVVGVYVGAGGVDETGYVYTGDVGAADLDPA